jgi:hypothetical protein
MFTIIRSEQSQLSPEAQAFLTQEPRGSTLARILGFVATLDAMCVVFVLLAA